MGSNAVASIDRDFCQFEPERESAEVAAGRRNVRHGVEWGLWDGEEAYQEISGSHFRVMQKVSTRTGLLGPLRLNVGEERLTIFDFCIHLGERQRTLNPLQQTVVSLELQHVNIPHFFLRQLTSNPSVPTEFLSCYDKADSMPAYAHNQIVESSSPSHAAAFLETKVAFLQLLPFLQEKQFTIEWTGDRLVVYRLQETIAGEALKQRALDVVRLGQLLREASEAYTSALDELVGTGS